MLKIESQSKSKILNPIVMMVWNEFLNDARVLKEANTLQGNGYQVIVSALKVQYETSVEEQFQTGVVVKRVNGKKPKSNKNKESLITTLWKVMTQVRAMLLMIIQVIKLKPAVIHAHDFEVLPAAWLVSKFTKAKIVYDAHEISTCREGFRSLRKLIGYIEKKLMPKAAATITTTEMRAKYFVRAYGVPRPKVLQNRPTYYELEPSARLRDELSLKEPWPIVVYQGGLQSGRGLERLVKAAQYVNDVYFVLIGSGRLESHLHELAKQFKVTRQVKFIPVVPLSELPEYTASADIGVQPILNTCLNHYTTDSNKLFEYVLAGIPVIATDFPEIKNIVNKYELGLLVDQSLESLVSAIKRLLDNSELREKFKANTLKERRVLSWESQESALLEIYKVINK